MINTNQLGLAEDYMSSVTRKLNNLLSDIQVFYMNVRGFHWNIKGNKFFVLHEKFEDLYNQLAENADEVAERILMLGGKPKHAFSDYLKDARVKEVKDAETDVDTINHVLQGLISLLNLEREISTEAAEAGDEGTVDLVTGYIPEQEKLVWMYSAFLSKQ